MGLAIKGLNKFEAVSKHKIRIYFLYKILLPFLLKRSWFVSKNIDIEITIYWKQRNIVLLKHILLVKINKRNILREILGMLEF